MIGGSTINAVISRLPYSDSIPERIRSLINNEEPAMIQVEPITKAPTIQPSPSEKIRIRMLDRRRADRPNSGGSTSNAGSEPYDEDDHTRVASEPDVYSNPMVELYLNEQNQEFNMLINRNLKDVMLQQEKFSDEVSWRRLVLELALSRSSDEATLRVNALVNKASDTVYSYIPLMGESRHTRQVLDDYENSRQQAETLAMLDPLDYDHKVVLLKQLMVDLGMKSNAEEVINYSRGVTLLDDATMVDKIELLTLLLVRLWFIGLRYFMPISKLLYHKFKENEIALVNNRNFSRFLTVLVRSMESLEEKLSSGSAQNQRHEQ